MIVMHAPEEALAAGVALCGSKAKQSNCFGIILWDPVASGV
jgi:hypothetical protein